MDYFGVMLTCLALNAYGEASVEPMVGKVAVAYVTINRTMLTNADLCDEVRRPKQFSWANGAFDRRGVLRTKFRPDMRSVAWMDSVVASKVALYGLEPDPTGGALWFYADYIKRPSWSRSMNCGIKIGHHYFCRSR